MKNIAIFASGSGTNAENIANYFDGNPDVRIALIVCNKPEAYVMQRAQKLNIPAVIVTGAERKDEARVMDLMHRYQIDFIVLAGYLLRIPPYLVAAYPRAIVNIHPALLPLHGGKGMYGDFVHEDVIRCGDKESGITIHYVNEQYDSGAVIFQAKCPVLPEDTPHDLATRIHALEYAHFPHVIAETIARLD
jgi:phosphoribosylglycinamide formyltransferase-1